MPIGSNSITGVPLLLLTAHMVLGFSHVRLPDFIDRRPVSRRGFQRTVLRLQPVLRPLERIIRPRLGWLFGQSCERILGAYLFLVTFALFLDRKSAVWGQSVAVRVDLESRRLISNTNTLYHTPLSTNNYQ